MKRGDPKRECRINNEKTANCQIDVDTTLKLQTAADNVVQQGGWKYIEDASHCTNHFENECIEYVVLLYLLLKCWALA